MRFHPWIKGCFASFLPLFFSPLIAQTNSTDPTSLTASPIGQTHRAIDYVGGWAVTSGGKTILELELEPTHDSAYPFDGALTHPHFTITAKAFTGVHGPLVREQIISSRLFDDHLFFSTRDGQGMRHDIEMWLDDNNSASLNILDLAGIRWPIIRTNTRAPFTLNWEINRVYTIDRPEIPPNIEVSKIFQEEKSSKNGDSDIAGASRRQRIRDLLNGRHLHTAQDYNQAGFVLSQSTKADDALLAHSLALAALANGDETAITTAINSLDRYLIATGHAQIYGTIHQGSAKNSPIQQPYDATVIPEDLRHELGAFEPLSSIASSSQIIEKPSSDISNPASNKMLAAPVKGGGRRKIAMGQKNTEKMPVMAPK
ncbi:hypothetical protein [Zymomonas mobilis]|uniref:Uncharacterized protein n=1 Tax=Zymomonas mobilis subsp. pomaceae (strain ATCC 29192 / DSM 22645 / JCM 10191 / CCUG 17912 / NBRC 13757 / NCIMB 11200 / NRRL B-4491 / Barker I) TaxID=579138 RepID=F8EUW2_ZYMMT|nr:hypothetical protein [Zymomonas mobilis]AEI37250.1 hypothetical protein Zymop_0347 [Zymomonas mobilis subsp. pomaceae ATCC 29192]MDX5948619.1 hypothetical protein [Zymomonas mobilis subsp. pomaceae]GEB88425.1 hypothetical protein ZMO02_00620 [Zymomonas mobilis subsp. pomaceae]